MSIIKKYFTEGTRVRLFNASWASDSIVGSVIVADSDGILLRTDAEATVFYPWTRVDGVFIL